MSLPSNTVGLALWTQNDAYSSVLGFWPLFFSSKKVSSSKTSLDENLIKIDEIKLFTRFPKVLEEEWKWVLQ